MILLLHCGGSWGDLGNPGALALAAAAAGLSLLQTVRLEYNKVDKATATEVLAALAHVPANGANGPGTGLQVS